MKKTSGMGVALIAVGVLVLVTGAFRIRTASSLQEGAGQFLLRQQEAQDAFHRDAALVGKRYQAGELDESGWRRETEAVSSRFQTDSETAGVAWVNQLTSANHVAQQGFGLLLAGLIGVVVGVITALRTGRIAQPSVPGVA